MKRYLNFRPTVAVALTFAVGILSGYAYLHGIKWIAFCLTALIVALNVVISLIKKKYHLLSLLMLIVSFAGFFSFQMRYLTVTANDVELQNVTVVGYITDDSDFANSNYVLREVSVMTDDGNVIQISGKVSLYLYENQINGNTIYPQLGYELTCKGNIVPVGVFKDGVNTYCYKKNINYYLNGAYSPSVSPHEPTITETIRDYISRSLNRYMGDEENAGVALSLIIGDKSQLSQNDTDAFRDSGIAHVLAISGLHVGFICAIFNFFLERLKVRKGLRVFAVIIPLFAYCWIVNFTPSVVRASIMTIVMLYANRRGSTGDMLTSLSIAVIAILAVSPLYLFDAGFLLSISAVFGIATVSLTIYQMLYVHKDKAVFKRLILPSSITVGATLGTLPAIVCFYGEVPLYSLITNILIIPLISIVFVMLLIGLLPLPLIGYTLWLPDKIIWLVRIVANWIAGLPLSVIAVSTFGLGAFAFLALIYVSSTYVNFSVRQRIIAVSTAAVLFAVSWIVTSIPKQTENQINYYANYREDCIIASNEEGNVAVVCNFSGQDSVEHFSEYIGKYKCQTLSLFIIDYSATSSEVLANALSVRAFDHVVLFSPNENYSADTVMEKYGVIPTLYVSGLSPCPYINYVVNGSFSGIYVSFEDFDFLYTLSVTSTPKDIRKVECICSPNAILSFVQSNSSSTIFGGINYSSDNYFSISTYGNFTITCKNDKILLEL